MNFVEQLNSMPSKEDVATRMEREQLTKTINGIHSGIKCACQFYRSQHFIEGYMVQKYDGEYCVVDYVFTQSLSKDNSYHINNPDYRLRASKGDRYEASLVCDSSKGRREGYDTITNDIDRCNTYVSNLKKLLEDDGFSDIFLEVFPCYDEYDVVKTTGFINPKTHFERQKTNKLLGYAIRIKLRW